MSIQDDNNVGRGEEDDWMSKLLHSHIFKGLPFQDIQKIFLLFEEIDVSKGDKIISQGDIGDYYYIISEGRFRVSRRNPKQNKEFKLADLNVGDGFGEEALIGNVKRNASVTALTKGKLIRINEDDFVNLIKDKVLNTVSYDETKTMVKQGSICLDARFKDEFEQATLKLKGSLNLPLNLLRFGLDKLDKDKDYIVYCDNGARSAIAAFLLMERGFKVSHLEGGIEKLLPPNNTKKETSAGDGSVPKDEHAQEIDEGSLNNVAGMSAKQMYEEQKKILAKLTAEQDGDMKELSNVMSNVLSSMYKQLEQVIQEKTEVEREKRILEKKLKNSVSTDKNK